MPEAIASCYPHSVRRHVQVSQTARAVLDDDKYVRHLKRRRDGHEEIAGKDAPRMTVQEG
jgi:hypothetical protein